MWIGKLARAAGVNVQTIRFYEREGLLRPPARSPSGYRRFESRDLDSVTFIRRCQELGFTLAEIKQLLELHHAVSTLPRPLRRKPGEIRAMLALGCERLRAIQGKIAALRGVQRQLTLFLGRLQASTLPECPASATRRSDRRKPRRKPA